MKNEIYNYNSVETIKLFDLDYNYILINEKDRATYYDLYIITNDKQEQILSINIDKLNKQNKLLQQQIEILQKSKSIYERNKLDKLIKYNEPNNDNLIDIELNEIKE